MSTFFTRSLAGAGAFALAFVAPFSAFAADETDTAAQPANALTITNTETVNATLDPTGELRSATLYDQLAIQGIGQAEYANPVSTAGLRNLDGFYGLSVEGGAIVNATAVDGLYRQRTLSDYDQELPVSVAVSYLLDGQEIEPSELVGKSGTLEVRYRVANTTGQPQDVSYTDAFGETQTETVTVYQPLAGSLSLEMPNTFSDVQSDTGGVVAGNGRGGFKLSFSLTLLPPLSQPEVEVGYIAEVTDAIVPDANLSIIPVVVDANPTASSAAAQYRDGIQTGVDLAAGAQEIDENLLKLADGAGDLLGGLIQLRDGAEQLQAGLVGSAAPGSAELAAGAEELAEGLTGTAAPGAAAVAGGAADLSAGLVGSAKPGADALSSGAADLADGLGGTAAPGSKVLSSGAGDLAAGLNGELVPGAQKVSAGLEQLQSGVENLSESVQSTPDYQLLVGTVNQIVAEIGSPTDTLADGTALGALNGIAGLSDDGTATGTLLLQELGAASAQLGCATPTPDSACANIVAAIDLITDPAEPGAPSEGDLLYQLGAIKQIAGLLSSDLYNESSELDELGASQALQLVAGGIGALVDSIEETLNSDDLAALVKGGADLADGVSTAAAGSDEVAAGADTLAGGLDAAAAGSQELADGAAALATGIGDAAGGSQQLASGASDLSDGLAGAADGAAQVAGGAGDLAEGIGDAAEGSEQLAAGLGDAAAAAPALEDGARQLSAEGTSILIETGNDVAVDFAQKVAVIEASAETTVDGGLPYGAPDGALRSAAYSIDIEGEDGESSQNTTRVLAGVGIGGLAVAGAAVMARRRLGDDAQL